jgi:Fe-S-cluster containining protein
MSEVGCHDCIGACCTRNTQLPLKRDEAEMLRGAGTWLHVLIRPEREGLPYPEPEDDYQKDLNAKAEKLAEGVGLFMLDSNCVFLLPVEDGMAKCALFNDDRRPQVCSTFTAGSKGCVSVRLRRGIF